MYVFHRNISTELNCAYSRLLITFAPISELPSDISTMAVNVPTRYSIFDTQDLCLHISFHMYPSHISDWSERGAITTPLLYGWTGYPTLMLGRISHIRLDFFG